MNKMMYRDAGVMMMMTDERILFDDITMMTRGKLPLLSMPPNYRAEARDGEKRTPPSGDTLIRRHGSQRADILSCQSAGNLCARDIDMRVLPDRRRAIFDIFGKRWAGIISL